MILKNKLLSRNKAAFLFAFSVALSSLLTSCNEDPLPEDPPTQFNVQSTSLFTATVNDNLEVDFRNYSLNVTEYLWEFGDNNSSSEDEPTHTYEDYGTYQVTLTTTNERGEVFKDSANVSLLSVGFSFELENNIATFTNQSLGAESYEWDFGDDSEINTTESPVYSYTTEGDFTVTLTAFSSDGAVTETFTQEVTGVELTDDGGTVVGEPVTINGFDFEPVNNSNSGGYDFWRWTDREGYSSNPWASTSTGFEGRGAKWDAAHSRLNTSQGDIRISYQALNVTPNANYTLEFYSRVDTPGDNIEVLILDGHFDTPTAAIASTPLLDATTADASGEFVLNSMSFTANSSGEIAIMMSAFIADFANGASVYLDNISLTPVGGSGGPTDGGDGGDGGNGDDTSLGTQFAFVTNTSTADTGEIRFVLDDALAVGKMTATIRKDASSFGNFDGFINLSGSSTSRANALIDIRVDDASGYSFTQSGDSQNATASFPTFANDEFVEVEISWDATGASDTVAPLVSVIIDGQNVTSAPFSSESASLSAISSGVSVVQFRIGGSSDIDDTGVGILVDNLRVYDTSSGSDVVVFEDDYESYTVGNSLDPNANDPELGAAAIPDAVIQADTPYNNASFQTTVNAY